MKVGIIGCGRIAQTRHIPEYCENQDTDIGGFYDLNKSRAKELAQRYGGLVYDTIEDMLNDTEIEAVSVCTANVTHSEITIKALEHGKHVLCEKPMAIDLSECEAMLDAVRVSGKKLVIDQNQRLARAHKEAKKMIERGDIGRVLTFRTTFGHGGPETWSVDAGKGTWFFDESKSAMGAMADLGVHKTDLIQYLIGQVVVETTAYISTLDKCYANGQRIGVDDNAICIYKLSGGVVGTMTASWTYYGQEDNSTVLYGTDGIMKIYDNPEYAIEIVHKDGTKEFHALDSIQTNDHQTNSGIVDLFVDTIQGKTRDSITGESVLPAMRAVFASLQSAKEKRTIVVEGRGEA